jgi:hypothetical protein
MSKTTNNLNTINTAAADDPQTAPAPTPEQLVEQLRTMRSTIPDAILLTPEQRKTVRNRAKLTLDVAQAQINTIGASQLVEQAVGQPADEVRTLLTDSIRWSAVEDEVRSLLNGIVSANLTRRQKVAFLTGQAYKVASSLLSDPAHSEVVQHVVEVRRLKRLARKSKPSKTDTPSTPAAPQTM